MSGECKFKGSKHDPNLTTTEIAKKIRQFITQEKKAGNIPKGMKISVRSEYFSGGSSIDAEVKALPEGMEVYDPKSCRFREYAYDKKEFKRHEFFCTKYSPKLDKILKNIKKFDSDYNFDCSDPLTDFFFVDHWFHMDVHYKLRDKALDDLFEYFKEGYYNPKRKTL